MICLQVGQCGIQVGKAVFDQLNEINAQDFPRYPFSTLKQLAVDTERKVWSKRQKDGRDVIESVYLDYGSFGRGNNWANGYFDDSKLDQLMEEYRKLLESMNVYNGCLMLHSLAGGTGSGLGARVISEIRDWFPKEFITTASFAPFVTGETAVQSYNTLLSLEVLQR
jgi:hypothetical protein